MARHQFTFQSKNLLTHVLVGLGLVGGCTVADKADYTFIDDPGGGGEGQTGGTGGTAGNSGGTGGNKGGTSGEAGEGNGGTSGTSGSSGEAGNGTGGGGGACEPNPCENDGACTSVADGFACDCADGWQGVTCDDNIDDCTPDTCLNGGTCSDLVADFSCACLAGPPAFTGKRCELPRFQVIGMGPAATARAVSADGTRVLGHFQDPMGYRKPFHWTFEEGGRPLPLPLSLRPDVYVTPHALSGDGDRWVGEVVAGSGGPPSPIGGSTSNAEMFVTPVNAMEGAVYDTNGDGTVSVGYFAGGPMEPGIRATRWNATGMPMPLMNPLTGTPYFAAGAVNRDGTIIVGVYRDLMNNFFVYSWLADAGSTVPVSRRSPMPVTQLVVHGVDNDGMHAVGTFWDTAMANFAYITRASTFENIAPMAGAVRAFSQAWDVSDDGQTIVGEANLSMMGMTGGTQAIVWKNDGTWRTLFDVLRENRAEPPMGFTLAVAFGVSADGKVVVGQGFDPGGQSVGFIARLP
jgi:uncharacterized membrane protein